jgi:hypothetical protein
MDAYAESCYVKCRNKGLGCGWVGTELRCEWGGDGLEVEWGEAGLSKLTPD